MFKRLIAVALCAAALGMGTVASAQDAAQAEETTDARGEGYEVVGLTVRPYVQGQAQRPTGPDDWSIGLTGGAKVEWDPIWGGVEYTFHDVLDDEDTYPFDGTFAVKLGVYKAPDEGNRVIASPYAAFVLARPTGPDDWSPGFEGGVEFILDPLYIGLGGTLRDIFLGKNDEVYDWDSEFALAVGAYF